MGQVLSPALRITSQNTDLWTSAIEFKSRKLFCGQVTVKEHINPVAEST